MRPFQQVCRRLHLVNPQSTPIMQRSVSSKWIFRFAVVNPVTICFRLTAKPCMKRILTSSQDKIEISSGKYPFNPRTKFRQGMGFSVVSEKQNCSACTPVSVREHPAITVGVFSSLETAASTTACTVFALFCR